MMEPKAQWKRTGDRRNALVGPFDLELIPRLGSCAIWSIIPHTLVWQNSLPTPCDVSDLMRIAEAELARRLVTTAETMEGAELVATLTSAASGMWTSGSRHSGKIPPATPPYPAQNQRVEGDKLIVKPLPYPKHIEFGRDPIFNNEDEVPAGWDVAETSTQAAPFRVGDKVTAKPLSRLRDVMIAAVGAVEALNDNGTVVVAFGRGGTVTCWPQDLEMHEEAQRFKIGDLIRTKRLNRVGVVAVPRYTDEHSLVDFADLKNETIHTADLEPYTFPPINSYADLARVLDELPEGVVVELRQEGCYPALTRRTGSVYEARYVHVKQSAWIHSQLISRNNRCQTRSHCRILSPSEVGK